MFEQNQDFFPTPPHLIKRILEDINFREISSVLEPSAGDGRLVEAIIEKFKSANYNSYAREEKKFNIDCIELDQNLRYILQGKGYRVVGDDFLQYESYKRYSIIIANFPFSEGCKHALKSLDMIIHGGQLVALINAETLRNPYSNERKELVKRLTDYNASIEYIENAFVDSERSTGVEVALIKVQVEKNIKDSVILKNLRQKEQYRKEDSKYNNNLISGDFIEGIIEQYNFEIKAGLNLISEYENLKPLMLKTFKQDKYSSKDSILCLSVNGGDKNENSNDSLINLFIKKTRYKYWEALFSDDKFTQLLTTNLLYEYRAKIIELQDYDFSRFNIKEIQLQINKNLTKGVEDTILKLFDEFSYQHSYHNQTAGNIHLFNGWKGNKCHMVSKRVVMMQSAYGWTGSLDYHYKFYDKIKDIQRIFDYLDDCKTEDLDLKRQLDEAEKNGQTKNIITKYFTINTFKKGTTHLAFTNEELLKKFNIFAGKHKNFLPPTYGKTKYKDMTKEDKAVIDEFEGEKSYESVMKDTKYYIYNPSSILMIEQ